MFFGRKQSKRKAIACITLLDAQGKELSSCPTNEFALPEEVVLALSVEYFNDPEPCHIHRGAVHRRALMELMELCPFGETRHISELPESYRKYFPPDTEAIRFDN